MPWHVGGVTRRHLSGISFLFPPCGAWGLNMGCQACWQAPLSTESSCCPVMLKGLVLAWGPSQHTFSFFLELQYSFSMPPSGFSFYSVSSHHATWVRRSGLMTYIPVALVTFFWVATGQFLRAASSVLPEARVRWSEGGTCLKAE